MNPRLFKTIMAFVVLALAFGLMQWAWVSHQSLFGLTVVSLGMTWALARALKPAEGEAWPVPLAVEKFPRLEKGSAPSRGRLMLGGLGLAMLAVAFQHLIKDQVVETLVLLVGAALCWRPLLDTREHEVPAYWAALLSALVIVLAAAFRFYKAGSIPQGLIHYDESLVYSIAKEIVGGKREIFNSSGNDGQVPYWAEAFCIKFFGDSIYGFRLTAVLSGFVMVALLALLGREMGGKRLGLAAGAFAAVGFWAVTFSRAEYLVASSYLPVLACLWLLLRGLRTGSPLSLAFSGLNFGLCWSIYNGGKVVPLFIVVFVGACLLWKKDSRRPLLWAALPFGGGLLIALSPLILWALHSPQEAYNAYFGKLNSDWIAGPDVIAAPTFKAKLDIMAGRIVPNFRRIITMLTQFGDGPSYCYFSSNQRFIDRALLFLLLPGMAACLARFKKPAYAMLLSWWFLAFLPALMATPQYWPSSRRIMMNLPATLLMGAVGYLALIEIFTRSFSGRAQNRLLLLASLGFFAFYTKSNWHTYFTELNRDKGYLASTQANYVNGLRAIEEQDIKSPIYLLTFRKPNADNWLVPDEFIVHQHHNHFLGKIPHLITQLDGGYFSSGGFLNALLNVPAEFPDKKKREVLVVLTPFHFYLEPVLKELGAEKVVEIMPAESTEGPSYADFGFITDAGPVHRMYRLKQVDRAKVEALKSRWNFPYVSEELIPPARHGTREKLSATYYNAPEMLAAYKDYEERPGAWKTQNTVNFSLADAYYWCGVNYLSKAPMRLKAQWTLNIPADGAYQLGLSTTNVSSLKVDGKKVFANLPTTPEVLNAGKYGLLGEPVELKAGPHKLEIEQLNFTWNPIVMSAIRLVWKKPGGQVETLPLEQLLPAAPK